VPVDVQWHWRYTIFAMSNKNQTQSLIKLHLSPEEATIVHVCTLEGIRDLEVDENYGLVCISPKRRLYAIRVFGPVDHNCLADVQHRVVGVYGDVKISGISQR